MEQHEMAYAKLAAGCNAENAQDFLQAVKEYREGLRFSTEDFDTAYFLNNNLGYSLIQLGEFAEAKKYCREAIMINPHRYNAHKNLGLALQGLGNYIEAAQSLQLASLMNPNPRARKHLDELLPEHPEIKSCLKTYTVIEEKRHIIRGESRMIQ